MSSYRVIRGGSYLIVTWSLRSAYRLRDKPKGWHKNVGFRVGVIRREP